LKLADVRCYHQRQTALALGALEPVSERVVSIGRVKYKLTT